MNIEELTVQPQSNVQVHLMQILELLFMTKAYSLLNLKKINLLVATCYS